MLRSGESETEILLGNKQLLGVFFLAAALLGVAFTGGYMLGRGAKNKTGVAMATTPAEPAAATPTADSAGNGGETHSVAPDLTAPGAANDAGEAPLGSRKRKSQQLAAASSPDSGAAAPPAVTEGKSDDFTPQSGQEYLQVAAMTHRDASAEAAVLRRKGFRAHAVPKPGNPNLYRVIVGPIRDAGDLASTRDSLRKTGFREVIVQHYQ